ncbi:MAG: DUF1489 domain-containing protein [Pseudomonadota bacterium]
MTLHLIKLSVGTDNIESLHAWQEGRLAAEGRLYHGTRQQPRRAEELLDGGSIYWVIKGLVACRQRLIGIEPARDESGRPLTLLLLDPPLVPVAPRPQRAFQGWRYLREDAAPPDLGGQADGIPADLAATLRDLGCW